MTKYFCDHCQKELGDGGLYHVRTTGAINGLSIELCKECVELFRKTAETFAGRSRNLPADEQVPE